MPVFGVVDNKNRAPAVANEPENRSSTTDGQDEKKFQRRGGENAKRRRV
jgi:hypothetical protein